MMFFAPDTASLEIPSGPLVTDTEPWSAPAGVASAVFADLVGRYRRVARLGRELRAAQPDHEELETIRKLLRHDGARIKARLQSYEPTDRQRRNPH